MRRRQFETFEARSLLSGSIAAPDLAATSDTGVSSADDITAALVLRVGGTTTPGSSVQVRVDGAIRATVTAHAATGAWSADLAGVAEGTRSITSRHGSAESQPLVVTVDRTAPGVLDRRFFDQNAPHLVRMRFSENVGPTLSLTDLAARNLTSGLTLPASQLALFFAPVNNAMTLSFPGLDQQVLGEGNWRVTLFGSGITDVAGNALAADERFDFFFLPGDANRDRSVDALDLDILSQNFGNLVAEFGEGDFNYDSFADEQDLFILMRQFGKTLPAPPPELAKPARSLRSDPKRRLALTIL